MPNLGLSMRRVLAVVRWWAWLLVLLSLMFAISNWLTSPSSTELNRVPFPRRPPVTKVGFLVGGTGTYTMYEELENEYRKWWIEVSRSETDRIAKPGG